VHEIEPYIRITYSGYKETLAPDTFFTGSVAEKDISLFPTGSYFTRNNSYAS
jgi:hypothetical protein